MSTTPVAQAHHLRRKAVIDIRQSTGHQVLTNTESQQLQHAMREHARDLGWPEERIEVVETDLGRSAQSTVGRDGYKALLAEVALGQVGIVLSYESTRLSRNCTDWYPLLDLCAYNQCLIADRDGVYDAATPNGRLLLGMKGIVSEVELHTLRGRLIAGVQHFWSSRRFSHASRPATWSASCVIRACASPVAIATWRRSGAPRRWRRSLPSCGIRPMRAPLCTGRRARSRSRVVAAPSSAGCPNPHGR